MDDLAPGDRRNLQRLAEEPYSEPVHPEVTIDCADRDGEPYRRASDDEIEELICEVIRSD